MNVIQRFSALLIALCAAACAGSSNSNDPNDFGTLNAATLELTAEGGIAALSTHQVVRHDDRAYVHTMRHICSTQCPPPLDSASGTLSAAATDSLFNIAWQQNAFSLNDDYGATKGGADMMTYSLRVVFDGRTKTIRADDGTMPTPMRRIVEAMRGAIDKARGK